MKIGLYLRKLGSLGGGERHALAIAETLARYHPVEVITHSPTAPAKVAERFNMDLSRISVQYIPEQSWEVISEKTAHYDLFVNSLHNTYVHSRAKRSAMLIFFPVQAQLPIDARIRRAVARVLNQQLTLFTYQDGIYGEELINSAKVRLLDHNASIALLPSRRAYDINFGLLNSSEEKRRINIRLDQTLHQALTLSAGESIESNKLAIPAHQQPTGHTLSFEIEPANPNGQVEHKQSTSDASIQASSGVRLINFQPTHPSHRLYQKLFEEWFPVWRDRLVNVPPRNFLDAVATYDLLWTNSEFSQQWTKTYWGRESELCYPQVEIDLFQPLPKKQQIISVGRFFRAAHNKKHLVMVEAFKEMVDNGLADWSLHLAGGVADEKLHLDYVEKIRTAAAGYPIHFHVNVPFEQLQKLYGESAIYWHAAGYGESATREPVKLEHFGMTTVEAMAAGCVPVVINRGGQPEIVEHGVAGFHWDSVDELQTQTLQLIADPAQIAQMSQAAIIRSKKFDRSHFESRLLASLEFIGCYL